LRLPGSFRRFNYEICKFAHRMTPLSR
jgi:hypothetical protein